ncbi:MAG: HAMP domain-containing protein [Verrucomicrobiales bacterium]|nr:HAMP domain-containing protein [Verrucomicrobiales bacterium]
MNNLNFKTKLLIAFLGLSVVTAALLSTISIHHSQKTARNHIRSNALSIAVSAAAQVDGDLHEQIQNPGDEETEAYRQIEKELRRIRDANRRNDVHVAFIYTMRRVAEDPDKWIYVVDAEEPGDDKSGVGDETEWETLGTDADEEPLRLGDSYAENSFTKDEFGVWLSANAPILNSEGEPVAVLGVDFKADDIIAEKNRILIANLGGLAVALVLAVILSILLARKISKPLRDIAAGVSKIGRGHLEHRMDETRRDEFGEINRALNKMSKSLLERDALKGALSRYVSQDAVKDLIQEGEFPTFRGSRKKMTILLCEIKNLEQLTEVLSPGALVELLNSYFDSLVSVIFKHKGTIDRLPGDGLSAVFGALGGDDDQETLAVNAAAELLAENEKLNKKWGLCGQDAFQLHIGVHTGDAIFGNIGSDHRVEFTVLGKSMKIASVIGDLNRTYQTSALFSEATCEKISDDFPFIEVGDFQPGPKQTMIRLYTLRSLNKAA